MNDEDTTELMILLTRILQELEHICNALGGGGTPAPDGAPDREREP